MNWQPIETAPKDGVNVLLSERYNDTPCVGFWRTNPGEWVANVSNYTTRWDSRVVSDISSALVTHWMPLPKPPESAA